EPLARALAAMHAAGIRHQDVKPDNIFLARIRSSEGRSANHVSGSSPEPAPGSFEELLPVLLDLGVAAKEAETVVAGTPVYFAPEVAAQFTDVEPKPMLTGKADVFSLALSLRNALEPETQEDVPAGAVQSFIEERSRSSPLPPRSRDLGYLEAWFRRWLS